MSAPRFVESVLLAEFDIDKGSVLRLQYPEKVSEDEGLLAELMMPEGVHNHFQDWTVFMLNRPAQAADAVAPKRWPVHAYRYDTALAEPEWVMATAGREGGSAAGATHWATIETPTTGAGALPDPPLLVVDLGGGGVQLRITHHDELQYSALQDDFVSLYTYDGEAVGLHFRSAAQQAEFKAALDAAAARAAAPPTPMLWCLNHVSNRRDKTVRRGAQVKALTVCSRFQFVHVWKPILLLAVDRLYSTSVGLGEYSETPLEQCRYLYDALNALPLAVLPPVSDLQRHAHRLLLAQGVAQKELTHVGHVQWQQSAIPLRVPLLLQPQELLDASVGDLLRRFKAGLLPVFHAILGRKRVLFLGHAQPAETVCAAVLSAPLLVCPPESAVLPRCFPYTTLNNLDFLSSPGFIAGSTNPIFESHPEWWDVLCDIDAGKVVVSALGDKGKPTVADAPKLGDADAEVLEQALAGVDAHYSEYWLRALFQEYAQQLAFAGKPRGAEGSGVPSANSIALHLATLATAPKLSDQELLRVLQDLRNFAQEESRLVHLLALLPASSPLGCLAPVSGALFHQNAAVRATAAELLRELEGHKPCKPCVSALNTFSLLAYDLCSHGQSR
jgi:hypothetical protein